MVPVWKNLREDIELELSGHCEYDVLSAKMEGLSVRKSRAEIELGRKAYKAQWARNKYRTNKEHRLAKVAQDLARYHRKKLNGTQTADGAGQ